MHERRKNALIVALHAQVRTSSTRRHDDDCHGYVAQNKHHEEHEGEEGQRTQNGMSVQQIHRVELHQQHLEQHLRREQQRRARSDLRHEQHMKQTDEGEQHEREDHHGLEQIVGCALQRLGEQMEASIEPGETDELDRRQKAAQAEKRGEHVVHIRQPSEMDEPITIRLTKHLANL